MKRNELMNNQFFLFHIKKFFDDPKRLVIFKKINLFRKLTYKTVEVLSKTNC